MEYVELKKAVLSLPINPIEMQITVRGQRMPEKLFVETCIHVLDNAPPKNTTNPEEIKYREQICLPFYRRLNAYYLLRQFD